MILTFDFKFLKKIKKGEAYITFILYILIFSSFASKKSQWLQEVSEFHSHKKLCIHPQKTMYSPTKNYVFTHKKLLYVGIM
ncbi:hypothetical protein CKN62_13425 [Carnobacterium divergens]|nr:hypothetical protein CKN62_13425 [Carnobacterium divergens]TFI86898.1 hypothetical protein CKN84_13440 [Carnobacterium divergens]TFJ02219.1 hypothetical protein CKN65_14050 [Carnobacterium divergens]